MASFSQFVGDSTEGMTFANPRLADGDDIGRPLEESSAFEAFQLQAQRNREGIQ